MSSEDATKPCSKCGCTIRSTVRCDPPSPHYARVECGSCGKFFKFEPFPLNQERIDTFTLPFGIHKGKKLPDVPVDYLRWMMANKAGGKSITRVVGFYLEFVLEGVRP